MTTYAKGTTVSEQASRNEIERTLERFGATGYIYGRQEDVAMIAFQFDGRHIRFILPIPHLDDPQFLYTPGRHIRRTAVQVRAEHKKKVWELWRALANSILAKLAAIEAGISTTDQEFLSHIVLPGGRTVGERLEIELDEITQTGIMPPLLPAPRGDA